MYKKLFVIFVLVIVLILPPNLIFAISETTETDTQLYWTQQTYMPLEVGKIQLIDSNLNKLVDVVETIQIHVWSDTDLNGLMTNLYETDVNSGIFEGKVIFTYDVSTENKLQIYDGDKIFVKYVDKDLTSGFEFEIISKSQIAIVDIPITIIDMSNVRITSLNGTLIDDLTVDKGVQIATGLENHTNEIQSFVYILQIQNIEGITVQLSWIEGDLYSEQKFHTSSSWLPLENGEYTITSFAWKSIDNPVVLAPPLSKIIMVS